MSEGPARPVARRNENPRRVVGGQRLLRADGFGPWPWPAEGWLLRVRAAGEEESMEGLAYAKSGQVATLSIAPGRVTAAVQGRMPRPHGVTVDWPPIEPSVIDLILRRLAADPAAAASVLLGEVPRSIESTFREHGVALSPCEGEPVRFCCSCGRLSGCRHEIAVAWILQDRIAIRLTGIVENPVENPRDPFPVVPVGTRCSCHIRGAKIADWSWRDERLALREAPSQSPVFYGTG